MKPKGGRHGASTRPTMPRAMTPGEDRVYKWLLASARGHRNAKTNDTLARDLSMSKDRLRDILAALVVDCHIRIGSHPDHGVFLIVDDHDERLAEQCLQDLAFPTMNRLRTLKQLAKPAAPAPVSAPSLFDAVGGPYA